MQQQMDHVAEAAWFNHDIEGCPPACCGTRPCKVHLKPPTMREPLDLHEGNLVHTKPAIVKPCLLV